MVGLYGFTQVITADLAIRIHDPNATWMILDGTYYQSYKYFHSFKNDIRVMFDFGPEVLTAMDTYALKLFGNDESHKLCAHIRRGDFLQHANLESQTNFVVPAVLRIVEFLNTELHVDALSLVFIGVKSDFWKALNVTQNFGPYFDHIYNASLSSRGEDMAFGATHFGQQDRRCAI
uniref:Nucleotid_trans domain-containing protein n=1 Tax=Panagrellus redivivus TaxID=6233 RepID=A0A7E4W8H0_PANRE